MGTPAGSYTHVQWHGGGTSFGGEATFWYNGSLHVAQATDVGVEYKIQSGDSIYAAKDLYIAQDMRVVRKIRSDSVVAGSVFMSWGSPAAPSSAVQLLLSEAYLENKTAANHRTALNVYATSEVYTRAESDSRYQRSSLMTSYYRKNETLPRTNVYARSEVYTQAEFNALLAAYITRANFLLARNAYSLGTHNHTIEIVANDVHNHNSEVNDESGHSHVGSMNGAIYA